MHVNGDNNSSVGAGKTLGMSGMRVIHSGAGLCRGRGVGEGGVCLLDVTLPLIPPPPLGSKVASTTTSSHQYNGLYIATYIQCEQHSMPCEVSGVYISLISRPAQWDSFPPAYHLIRPHRIQAAAAQCMLE